MDDHLRETFKVSSSFSPVYSGGPLAISDSFEEAFFYCGDGVNYVDLKTGKIIETIETKGDLEAICFHSATRQLVTCASSHLITTYKVPEGLQSKIEMIKQWKGHQQPVNDITFHPSGNYIATACNDHTARVWDVKQGYCTHNFKDHGGLVTLVRFHPGDHKMQLFTCCDDYLIRIWDLVSKKCISLESHMSLPTSLCFSLSGWELISGGRDKVINIWDLHKNELKKTIPVYEIIEDVKTIPNSMIHKFINNKGKQKIKGTYIMSCGSKGKLRIWNSLEKEVIMKENHKKFKTELCKLFISNHEDNEKLISLSSNSDLLYYNTNPLSFDHLFVGSNDEIIDIKYIENGNSIAVASNCKQVRLFDTTTMACRLLGVHKDIILSLDVSKSGDIIATASKDNTIRFWDIKTLSCIAIGAGHTESATAVCMSKKSNDFAISGSQDKTIKIWDVASSFKEFNESQKESNCKSIMTTKAHDMEINSIAISPNDQIIATASRDKLVKLWDKTKLKLLGVLRGHKRGVWCVQFSPIDRCVASSSGDKTIKIWSLTDYSCLRTFEGHTGSVLRFSFITKGMQLLSSGSDGLIKLWTIKTNECVNTFEHHDDKVWALATKNDGNEFTTGDGDCMISFWNDQTIIEKEKEQQTKETQILQEQKLSNLLHQENYKEAITIAFELDQPFRIRSIFSKLYESQNNLFEEIIKELNEDSLGKCISYIRDWNTNARFSIIAQETLYQIMKTYSPKTLMKIPNMKTVLQGLIPYTDRHFQRLDLLLQKSCIIDFTLERMNILTPQGIDDNENIEIEEITIEENDNENEIMKKRKLQSKYEPVTKKQKISHS